MLLSAVALHTLMESSTLRELCPNADFFSISCYLKFSQHLHTLSYIISGLLPASEASVIGYGTCMCMCFTVLIPSLAPPLPSYLVEFLFLFVQFQKSSSHPTLSTSSVVNCGTCRLQYLTDFSLDILSISSVSVVSYRTMSFYAPDPDQAHI